MKTQIAFLIKDLEPHDGEKDTIGIIALSGSHDFSLAAVVEAVQDALVSDALCGISAPTHDPVLSTGLEEINGVLVGCVYIRDNIHRYIEEIANQTISGRNWAGTVATPQAVALYIDQMKGFDCIDPTGPWKGFFNNQV